MSAASPKSDSVGSLSALEERSFDVSTDVPPEDEEFSLGATPASNLEATPALPTAVSKVGSGLKRPRKEKKLKDPSAPKRPMSAFMIFANQARPSLLQQEGEQGKRSIGEVGKELGRMWANMEQETKGKYEAEAKRLMEEYHVAVKNYTPSEAFLKDKEAHEESLKIKKIKVNRKFSFSEASNYFDFVSNNWSKIAKENENAEDLSIPLVQEKLWDAWSAKGKSSRKGKVGSKKVKEMAMKVNEEAMFQAFIVALKPVILEQLPESTDEELKSSLIQKWANMTKEEKAAFQEI